MPTLLLGIVFVFAVAPPAAYAEVTRVEIASRGDVLGGKAFGLAGPYEKITGTVFFAVSPDDPLNRSIVDIDKAPRNSRGQVEFAADLHILKPKDPARGNGVALFDVLNRGRKLLLGYVNRSTTSALDPSVEADFGDGFLMRQGFTLVWIGWQFDVPRGRGLMGLDAPVARDRGRPITGLVTTTFTPTSPSGDVVLSDVRRYAPVDPASAESRLTVREGFFGTPHIIPRDQWRFGRIVEGTFVTDPPAISLGAGFQPGRTYELTYRAQAPVVAGLGLVAFRDLGSVLKYQPGAVVTARYAYVFGASQSGRFLRDFLYQGFNADEQGRKVFDGVIAHIAGAARGSFSARFATPNSLELFTATRFPFLDASQHDPLTDKTDGLFTRTPAAAAPKVFYTNSSTEYWGGGRAAALIHTTLDGREDARVPENVRIYLLAGTQHGSGSFPPADGQGQQQANTNDYRWALRALVVAMDRWVREGVPPPASRHPRLADGTLTSLQRVAFPSIPGVRSPSTIPGGYRADIEGPVADHRLPFLVPQVDADGNEQSGIRLPDVAVPLATYTGWNFRSPSVGAPTELLPLAGSHIPLAPTRVARARLGDPRPSIEERYPSRAAYLGLVTEAALKLVQEGHLLSEDVPGVVSRAMQHWDYATRSASSSGQ
jgi:hypothetical protein